MVVAEVVDLDYPLRLRKMDRLRLKSVFKAAPKAFGAKLSRSRGWPSPCWCALGALLFGTRWCSTAFPARSVIGEPSC